MKTVFCYYTNGKPGTNALRVMSMASLRRFVPGAEVVTLFAGESYGDRLPGEKVVDLTPYGTKWFGVDAKRLAGRTPGNGSLPLGMFAKYLIPLVRELSDYDQAVVMDDDVEVVGAKFAEMSEFPLRPEADVAMVRDSVTQEFHDQILGKRRSRSWWFPGSHYHNGGLLVFRCGDLRRTYADRVVTMFLANEREKWFLSEESAANQFLAVQSIDPAYCMIPKVSSTKRGGVEGERLKSAAALHYAGGRKRGVVDDWKRRYEAGLDVDFSFFR